MAGLYHIISDRAGRPAHFPPQELVVHDSRRSAQHQELSIAKMANAARLQGAASFAIDWNATSEQLDGAMESAVLSDASWGS